MTEHDGIGRTGMSRRAVAGLLAGVGGVVGAEFLAAAALGLWAAAAFAAALLATLATGVVGGVLLERKAGLRGRPARDTGDRQG